MLEEILARSVQVFLALAGGYLVVLWFALVVWTYRDIGSRSQSVVTQVFATLLSLLFFVPGVLLYLLMRPRTTLDEAFQRSLEEEYLLQDIEEASLCPSCQRQVSDDYILCPHCQANLKQACTTCNQLIKIGWPVCPYCGSDQTEEARSIRERVEPPEDRYLERGARTFRQIGPPTIRESPLPTPAVDSGHEVELAELVTEPRLVAETPEETATPEADAPIRLFDRKRTRARKHKSSSPESDASSNGRTDEVLEESANEDSAIISHFVANGNGVDHQPVESTPSTDESASEESDVESTSSR